MKSSCLHTEVDRPGRGSWHLFSIGRRGDIWLEGPGTRDLFNVVSRYHCLQYTDCIGGGGGHGVPESRGVHRPLNPRPGDPKGRPEESTEPLSVSTRPHKRLKSGGTTRSGWVGLCSPHPRSHPLRSPVTPSSVHVSLPLFDR